METRNHIRFLLNGEEQRLDKVRACDTLLDFLRLKKRLTGTKEGCAEGDCGACTVLVGRLRDGVLRYEPVNACIRFLATVDGCHVVTVEHLRGPDGGLNAVQAALVEHHGSQCGFCTPGIVMALYALWMEEPQPSEAKVEQALQGNLCRCTGYEPIVRAAMAAAEHGLPEADPLVQERAGVLAALEAMRDRARVELGDAVLPGDVGDFAALYAEQPEAIVVAGATDVGLWVTKFLRDIGPALFIGHLDGLQGIDDGGDAIRVGAGVSYSDAIPVLERHFPHLSEYLARIAGWQVRNMGTIGGNIANGSPIGDMPPVLIALGARVALRRGKEQREMPLEDFFIDYGKQDRQAGEFVEAIVVPKPEPDVLHAAWKVSKRRDEDISSVAAGLAVTVANGHIANARVAFGGMAGVPKRAEQAEAALIGAEFSQAAFEAAAKAVVRDFEPLSDWRASADYRMLVAQNLFRRFWAELGAGEQARVWA
ncbi:xanthine dehydrogenase small subunit [Alisedimentitalea sp. MJ-SS2]|uniref:xanthine dehydrogenase small subunit n=1 Tax=Aliisedimentitalea sp. MJ-SS2 TaxID=3049795 RepID=UPI002912ADA6|nr:xanthine dehydrogenase small subunit [Alisedimentitalea sp. MJ-SS2]MDU8929487.1 xanthine dehydrogenase small subunit [Alisedimentitalea sp. MJ-SS2]